MTNGFARVIIWDKDYGIEFFFEGRFMNGLQYDLGRFLNMDPNALMYNFDQAYTGWIPNGSQGGIGISVVDSYYVHQGDYKPLAGFPNGGRDMMYSGNVNQFVVTDFTLRNPIIAF
jgi:hypothetical protein